MAGSPKLNGAWDRSRVERHLVESVVPLRLAIQGASGFPVLVSLWYFFEEGCLWCAVQRESRVGQLVARESRCAFEVAPNEPPYFGVRGQGHARLLPDAGPATLDRLMDRYLGDRYGALRAWLEERAATETAIRIESVRLTSWDFTQRMQG
jgi:nitroimidazol reductase NimA-like FMN-containing flavoprotein (pyridoxamine 5'-phosphate oxidase superfamily)